jgi:hypothetical protein
MKRSDALLAAWDSHGPDLLKTLNTQVYKQTARAVDQAGRQLSRAGAGPAPASVGTLADDLRRFAATGQRPPTGPGGPGGPNIDVVTQTVNQRLAETMQWARGATNEHPEAGPAIMAAFNNLYAACNNDMMARFRVLGALGTQIGSERARLVRPS